MDLDIDNNKDVPRETQCDDVDIDVEARHDRSKIVTVFIALIWGMFVISIGGGQVCSLIGVKVPDVFVELVYALLWGGIGVSTLRVGGEQLMNIIKQRSGRFGGRF